MSTSPTHAEPPVAAPAYANGLLATLPPDELAALEPLLEPLELGRRQLLHDPLAPIEHVYFVESGVVSILSVLADGSAVETATIGREGMIGMAVFHGVNETAEQAMVQVPGSANRIRASAFRAALPTLPALNARLHRFASYCFTFAAQNSACNRKHSVEQRLARWLLIVRDRVSGDDLALTHDFVSQMLGVRRASVTDTLAALERAGLISTGRNRITVLDAPGLVARVCECYAIVGSAAARLLANVPAYNPLESVETSRDGLSIVGDGTPLTASTDEPVPA